MTLKVNNFKLFYETSLYILKSNLQVGLLPLVLGTNGY